MSRRTSIRIPTELWAWLSERAKHEGRTVSNLIVYLLEQERTEKGKHTDTHTNARDTGETHQEGTP